MFDRKISLILMASGYSRRFGSNKLFYEIDGEPMFGRCLKNLLTYCEGDRRAEIIVVSRFDQVVELTGQLTEKFSSCRENHSVSTLYNDSAAEGIAASVRLGVMEAFSHESDWFVFFTADQPFIKAETIASFIDAAIDSGKTLASVCACGQPGNPTIFHKKWAEDLSKLKGDRGGRKILKEHPEEVFWFEISPEEIRDIDEIPG